jgi:hypothetical protein
MNWKGCGRERSLCNLRYYPGICLDGLRKIMENLNHNSRYPGRDLNTRSPECGAGALPCRPRHSIETRLKNTAGYYVR